VFGDTVFLEGLGKNIGGVKIQNGPDSGKRSPHHLRVSKVSYPNHCGKPFQCWVHAEKSFEVVGPPFTVCV
jgi:hypothetical protein